MREGLLSETIGRTFSSTLWYGCSEIVPSWLVVTADISSGVLSSVREVCGRSNSV